MYEKSVGEEGPVWGKGEERGSDTGLATYFDVAQVLFEGKIWKDGPACRFSKCVNVM
jgi:hypothetical protein